MVLARYPTFGHLDPYGRGSTMDCLDWLCIVGYLGPVFVDL